VTVGGKSYRHAIEVKGGKKWAVAVRGKFKRLGRRGFQKKPGHRRWTGRNEPAKGAGVKEERERDVFWKSTHPTAAAKKAGGFSVTLVKLRKKGIGWPEVKDAPVLKGGEKKGPTFTKRVGRTKKRKKAQTTVGKVGLKNHRRGQSHPATLKWKWEKERLGKGYRTHELLFQKRFQRRQRKKKGPLALSSKNSPLKGAQPRGVMLNLLKI